MELKKRHWVEKVEKWKESGLSQTEFCRHEEINRKTFATWYHRYKRQIEGEGKGFVEITPSTQAESCSESTSSYPVEISAAGIHIKINGSADGPLIENIFKALEGRLCS